MEKNKCLNNKMVVGNVFEILLMSMLLIIFWTGCFDRRPLARKAKISSSPNLLLKKATKQKSRTIVVYILKI